MSTEFSNTELANVGAMQWGTQMKIAVILPCRNEEGAVGTVVRDFQQYLPAAIIYVFDNNSTDDTAKEARDAGAIVLTEKREGKGHVVRRMFADVDADVYLMVDGDDSYDISVAPELIGRMVDENVDIVNGSRRLEEVDAYRPGHEWGNKFLTGPVGLIFGREFDDMLSGYKVFSRRFVKSFPQFSSGFEIESELTIHALQLQMPTAEVETSYRDRAHGTESKLNTFADGFHILRTIYQLLMQGRPLLAFGVIGILLAGASVVLAYPIFVEFFATGVVPRIPTAILCTGLMLLGFLSITCGFILDVVTKGRQEAKRMRYLAIPCTRSLLEQSVS
ncbi:MAG: glycosyltransferase family 2 protein [Woeseiaceae bacterium]|nr:glycosyltransferase family 2 protein [Woeseiaceae bacterium]